MHTALLSGSPILDVDATFLIYLGVFAFLFFLLNKLIFRPMMALFDEREASIDGAKREARALEKEAEDKLTSFEKEMAKVRTEASSERDRLRAEAQRQERTILEKVRKETDETIAAAEAEMAKEAAKARKEIQSASKGLAKDIAQKLLAREVQG